MKSEIIPHDACVLVADGKKALLLRNIGTAYQLMLEVEQVIEASANPLSHEQGTDRPGRTWAGSHRSSVDETDFHDLEEQRFSTIVAERLETICAEGAIGKLVIAAAPKSLANLRHAMSESLSKRVIAEYDKDLVNLPIEEIQRHLASER